MALMDELPGRIEASFRRRVEQLPAETRRLLLLAAADPTGESALLVRASEQTRVAIDHLAPAEADGLLERGERVTFRHPLLRSAIYRAAPSDERRDAQTVCVVAEAKDVYAVERTGAFKGRYHDFDDIGIGQLPEQPISIWIGSSREARMGEARHRIFRGRVRGTCR